MKAEKLKTIKYIKHICLGKRKYHFQGYLFQGYLSSELDVSISWGLN